MKRVFIAIFILLSCHICSAQSKQRITDSIQIRNTVNSFYNWYNLNWKKLDAFKLYKSIKTKEEPPYKIDWPVAERYFTFIRKNIPQLAEAYITGRRAFLKQCDSAFKDSPEDEIPFGFDYDWYTDSQEDPQWLIEELKKAKQWAITISGTEATVDVLGSYIDNGKEVETVVLCNKLKKEKGKWKIEQIGCTFVPPSNLGEE
jgi:hypothetical protein